MFNGRAKNGVALRNNDRVKTRANFLIIKRVKNGVAFLI